MVTGGGDKPARRTDPGVRETAPGGILPAGAPGDAGRVPDGAGRVRRPADLLFAVLSLAVVAVVLGSIQALPLGSTELADDVSAWLHHIPGWLSFGAEVVSGVAWFVLAVVALVVLIRRDWRDARNAAAAGFAGAAAAVAASAVVAGRERRGRACRAARQQSLDLRGGHRVRRVRGGNGPDPAFALVALVAVRGCGVAAQRPGRGRADAFRRGDRALRRAAGRMAGALASRRGVGPAEPGRTRGLAQEPGRGGPRAGRGPPRAAGRHADRWHPDPGAPLRP